MVVKSRADADKDPLWGGAVRDEVAHSYVANAGEIVEIGLESLRLAANSLGIGSAHSYSVVARFGIGVRGFGMV